MDTQIDKPEQIMHPLSGRNQHHDAQVLYDGRSASYDDSWHGRFARHMVELAEIQPGEHVLDLACGTGLATFSAAHVVGPSGSVVGVDISTGMLFEAEKKLSSYPGGNIEFFKHSIDDLQSLKGLEGRPEFDVITCCSALVLFEKPKDVVAGWVKFLRPGGRLVVDVTHPRNLVPGTAMEEVGRDLGRLVPYHRSNFKEPRDLTDAMAQAGLMNIDVKYVAQASNQKTDELHDYLCELDKPVVSAEYTVEDADAIFERCIGAKAYEHLAEPPEVRQRAKEVFKQKWADMADADGKVRDIDMVFVGIGKKS